MGPYRVKFVLQKELTLPYFRVEEVAEEFQAIQELHMPSAKKPKKGSKSTHKTITVSILKPINSGLSKDEFIKVLENNIYSELNLLN